MITAATLLGGLFLYDIFWVFGTAAMLEKSVMVEVATGLDAPIKVSQTAAVLSDPSLEADLAFLLVSIRQLLFPKDPALTASAGFTMLGLGDIIIPGTPLCCSHPSFELHLLTLHFLDYLGVMVALALRLDFSLHARAHPTKPLTPSSSFPKPYFYSIIAAYVAGLATTIIVVRPSVPSCQARLRLTVRSALTSFVRCTRLERPSPLCSTFRPCVVRPIRALYSFTLCH